jgi:hypothetical protein
MAIDFGKMIGPLPLGAWLVVLAGGAVVAIYTYQSTTGEPEIVDDASGDAGVGMGGGQYEYTPPVPRDDGVAPKPTTNTEWGVQAITWLIAQGNPPGAVTNAITKALAGGTGDNALNAQEYALWQLALKQFGPPPDPVTVPAPGTGGPTTPPPPRPVPEGPTSPPKATSGFVQEKLGPGVTRIRWNRVPWAAGYDVLLNNVWVALRPRSLEYYAFKAPPLKKNVNYTIGVRTRNVLNQVSPIAKFVFKIT